MAERTPAWCAQPADASSAACVSASRAVPTSATSRPTSLLKESVGPLPALKGKVVTGGRLNIARALDRGFLTGELSNRSVWWNLLH